MGLHCRVVLAVGVAGVVALQSARADSINGKFDYAGAHHNYSLPLLGGGTYEVGALVHTWSGGTGQAAAYDGTFGTFCMDKQSVSTQTHTFNLIDVTNAPVSSSGNAANPGHSYTNIEAHRLDAVARAAKADGYLDNRGAFVGNSSDVAAAIQLLVWDSVWEPDSTNANKNKTWSLSSGTFRVSGVSNSVKAIFSNIAASASSLYNINGQLIVRSLASNGGQDQLVFAQSSPASVMVPLPPASFAGAGVLAGLVGMRAMRRRQNVA